MPAPYSEDLRVRVIDCEGGDIGAAARTFQVAASTAITWVKEWRENGRTAAKSMGGSSSPLEPHGDWLLT